VGDIIVIPFRQRILARRFYAVAEKVSNVLHLYWRRNCELIGDGKLGCGLDQSKTSKLMTIWGALSLSLLSLFEPKEPNFLGVS